jgi:hypothetical protein
MIDIAKLSEPINPADIQLRVGMAGKNSRGVWCTLLAYKDSRVDVARLNEVCGMYWSNSYRYDEHDNLICSLSIYDEETKQWITREDVGTESNTEKEKGSHSDALKRAGFRWGIGNELYQMPLLYISLNDGEYTERNGKYQPRLFGWSLSYDKGYVIVKDKKGTERAKQKWDKA